MTAIVNSIPESAWKSMGNEVIRQICNIVYFDDDKSPKRYPKREILNIITDFIKKNINRQIAEGDEKFKTDFLKSISENIAPPMAKLYENDIMSIRLMEAILKDYPHLFMNVINTIAEKTDESIKSNEGIEFIDIFMQNITTYIRVENTISQTANMNVIRESSSPVPEIKTESMGTEVKDIPNLQQTIIDNIKTYGSLKNVDNMENIAKLSDGELIQHIDELIENIGRTKTETDTSSPDSSSLSVVTSAMSDANPFNLIIKETVGNMPKEFVNKVFTTLDTSDEKPYSEIKTEIYSTILSALRYHLEKPEGRQMYLRQIEPIVRHYAVQSLMNDDTTIICIFQLIRDSPKINSIIRNCVGKAYDAKNRNFTPDFGSIKGGATSNPFTAFRNALEPTVNKVLGKNMPPNAEPSAEPNAEPSAEPSAEPNAEPNVGPITGQFDINTAMVAYQTTFAYEVYQLVNSEIQNIIQTNNPVSQIYKDLEQFKVPKLITIRKNTIDYAQTMCSPGMLQNEMKNKQSGGRVRRTYRKIIQKRRKYTRKM